jgi:voltage-gated potassium channel
MPLRRRARATLRQRSMVPVWAQIGWRVALVLGLLAFAILFHWIERDGLHDSYDGEVSFLDVVYFTMISVTTTGYGDIVPVNSTTRLFDALVATPIRIFFILIFIGTAYDFVLRRTWDKWKMGRIQSRLASHVIVAGFGTTGSQAVTELVARGTPPGDIVVIDRSADALRRAEALGCAVLDADATRDKVLQSVRIETARAMIVAAGSDDSSILITLTARHLAPHLAISTAVRNEDNELLAEQAGATTVINPVSLAGLLLAGSTASSHTVDYIADLASADGRVHLHERPVAPEECGRSLAELVSGLGVRVYRGGAHFGFWEPEAASLQPGDIIVEIVATSRA